MHVEIADCVLVSIIIWHPGSVLSNAESSLLNFHVYDGYPGNWIWMVNLLNMCTNKAGSVSACMRQDQIVVVVIVHDIAFAVVGTKVQLCFLSCLVLPGHVEACFLYSVLFSWRWYLTARESPYALVSEVSPMLPWDGSNAGLIDNGPLSSFRDRLSTAAFFLRPFPLNRLVV